MQALVQFVDNNGPVIVSGDFLFYELRLSRGPERRIGQLDVFSQCRGFEEKRVDRRLISVQTQLFKQCLQGDRGIVHVHFLEWVLCFEACESKEFEAKPRIET